MRISERSVSVTEEKRIITGLIVSTDVCKRLIGHIDLTYFTNKYLQKVASWCVAFYEEHEEAPFKHIGDIFESESHRLKETESDLIEDLLTNLSKMYTGDDINSDYVINSAEEYFKARELEITVNNISVHKENGDIELAEQELNKYHKVQISLDENIYINPGDPKTRERLYKKRDEKQVNFFQFPGDLGKFLGNSKPDDVIGITAPAKRGKSFLLTDICKHGVLASKHVLKWSIEMIDTEELERSDKAFHPMVNKEAGIYKFPVFDCMRNQTGNCGERLSTVIIREDEKDPLIEDPDHVVCTKCRSDVGNWMRFQPTVYHEDIYRDDNSIFTARREMKKFQQQMNKYYRIVVRDKYSLTYDLMMRDLDIMDSRHGFIPSILVLDYIDILSINSSFDDYRLDDEKWKLLARIAGATKCLVATGTQSNKEGARAKVIHGTDQAGFYGKSRHVNLMIAINQDAEEKRLGMWRCGITDARSGRQDEDDSCLVLQDFKAGQMHLDSYWPGKFYKF